MDACAELTLQIARVIHERAEAPRSPVFWSFHPDGRRVTWPEAGAILAAATKPLLVAPLVEPGALALWSVAAMDDRSRAAFADAMANTLAYSTRRCACAGSTTRG